ncbi:hypothetical protein [Streptomyces sp. NBC_01408]|uniref:hypothetical protein n=1 Tax=Streptomyces sp. NBC_01408 TaxID=2903855 RepID=UPI00225B079A|nr:hypothetical protein [Streptomyces sp. NBC_01408]MCX4691010.1 hypothetical protein [Streptomyces sp. NBC_01408]
MSTVRRRTLVRAAAVTACAGSLLALPAAAALAEGVPAASAAHSAAPQRTPVKSLALADGVSTAKVYRIAEGVYRADILTSDGRTAATLTSRDGVTAMGSAGELHAALDSDGRLTSWVGDASAKNGSHAVGGDGYKTGTRSGQVVAASVPRTGSASDSRGESGGSSGNSSNSGASGNSGNSASDSRSVAAARGEVLRLKTLADGPGEGVLLLAAGGAIAAVGAAGLGFAMLRRGRTSD